MNNRVWICYSQLTRAFARISLLGLSFAMASYHILATVIRLRHMGWSRPYVFQPQSTLPHCWKPTGLNRPLTLSSLCTLQDDSVHLHRLVLCCTSWNISLVHWCIFLWTSLFCACVLPFRSSTYVIKWVDDTHALIIFTTEELGEGCILKNAVWWMLWLISTYRIFLSSPL